MFALPGRGVESMHSVPDILVKTERAKMDYYEGEVLVFRKGEIRVTLECSDENCNWEEHFDMECDLNDEIFEHITWHSEGMQE